MKKILSLLVLLVTTLSAFALDFTDYRKVTLGSYTPTESNDAKLSVTDNGDGTYNVTFNDIINKDVSYTDNYGTFTFSNVSGSKSGDVTTVTATDVTGTVSGGTYNITEFTKGNLSLKFKDGKAYATMTATCRVFYSNYTFDVVFGTDEGFDGGSTGGGETGGETSSIVTVKENFQSTEGSSWGENVTIDWNTQKLVVSVNLASTGSDKGFLGVTKKGQTAGWNNYGIIFYNTNGSTVQGYAPGQPNNANTNQVTKGEDPVRFEISKDGGVKCQGNVVISASNIAHLTNQSEIVVGAADKPAGALYNYIKVVPLNWTEVPPVTVKAEVPFTGVTLSGSNGVTGTADVTFKEMSDETVQMTFNGAGYGISATNLTKGTDAKGRTTYTGEAVSDVMSTVTYTVNAVVYSEGTTQKLYMTMVDKENTTFTVGEDPDYVAPVTYKNTLYVVEKAKLLVETPDAEVVLQDKGDNKYDVTLPAFTAGGMNVPSITFEATKADNKLTASNVSVADVYSGEAAVVTMDGTFEADGKLFASLTVKCGEWFDYEVGYGIKPFVATTKEYTAEWANVKVGDAEPVNFQNAKADYTEFAKGQYSLTFKDLTIGGKKIGDFTIKYVHMDKMGQLSTTAAAGTWTRVEADQNVASEGAEASISGFEGTLGGTGDGTLFVKFTINAYGTVAVDFGHKYKAPEPPVAPKDETVVEKYQADGTGFSHKINVDWDKQKIVASIDFSNGGDDKDILAMTTGESFTAFQTSTYRTMHWYCNQTAKQMSGFFAKDGAGNNNTGRMDVADCLAKFEISKAEGLKVNGVVKMTPEVLKELLTGDPIIIGSGESPKFSTAYYNYIKVVSLDWKEPTEPTEPEVKVEKTFNEALYMNEQKFADAKVVVKEMSDNTVNMSLQFNGNEYTSTELTKGTDEKNRTTYTGKVSKDTQTYDVAGVVYEKDNAERLYMTMTATGVTFVVGENPDVVTPEVTEVSNKTYTSNLRILDGETTVVEEAEANVNIVKYSDESYKVTLKNVNMLNKTQDLVFVGKALIEEAPTEATEPLTIIAKSDEATTAVFGEQVSGTFEITEVSADEIKMGFSMESQNFSYQGEFNYTEEEEPEVYTNNLHIYDAAAPETDLFQADQAKVEFLATETGEFKLTLKDVTLNEKTQDLVFTGALPTPQPGGQDPLAEEGEGEVTPAEPAMVLNATADEATSRFFGSTGTYVTAVFNVSYDKNDNFMMTFIIDNNYGGEFNYEKKTPETPDVTVEVEKTFTDSFSLNNVSLGNAKVTIKEMSDKTINMVFTFGTNDFTSTDLVKGTDDKNRTTYTGTISIGGVECVVNGVVYTKDNAEKLYMTLVSTTSGTYVFGTEPTDTPEPPVVEEYPINFDKDANSTHSSRVLNSFSLQQTGKDKQTKSVKTSKAAYEDHTADEPFTVEAGSELTASFDYTGEWMHSFVYIDFDNDGQFSYKEGQWDQTGTDLVAFSFYSLDSNPKNDASGYNSVGDELTGDARNTYVAPSFKAPAKAGEYRIRFKIDWNCILPGGSSSILSDGGGVWDATLKVVEPVVDGISSINGEVANGEAQLFTIDGVKLNKLQKGLNIVRTADGKVKKVLVK